MISGNTGHQLWLQHRVAHKERLLFKSLQQLIGNWNLRKLRKDRVDLSLGEHNGEDGDDCR
ncbi:hypothetical protein HBNCFIEN_02232 [Legionella sp. PC997]|nr:hypothetical protein HBNCFIEN_02232 [Legionella sp. PC997]